MVKGDGISYVFGGHKSMLALIVVLTIILIVVWAKPINVTASKISTTWQALFWLSITVLFCRREAKKKSMHQACRVVWSESFKKGLPEREKTALCFVNA